MIHIEPSKYVKGCILINGKALPVELYNKFKNKFTIPEQEAIENYLKVKKIMNQIKRHEKAIRLLEAIDRLNNRILGNNKYIKDDTGNYFFDYKKYYTKRIEIDLAIKKRLQNYYNKSFKL